MEHQETQLVIIRDTNDPTNQIWNISNVILRDTNQLWHISRVHSLFFATLTTVPIKQEVSVCDLLRHEQLYQPNMKIVCFFSWLFV